MFSLLENLEVWEIGSYLCSILPKEIHLSYPWIQDELSKTENAIYLKDELTDRILALPHDALRQDLENLMMYHIGLTCDGIPEGYDDGQYICTLSGRLHPRHT